MESDDLPRITPRPDNGSQKAWERWHLGPGRWHRDECDDARASFIAGYEACLMDRGETVSNWNSGPSSS